MCRLYCEQQEIVTVPRCKVDTRNDNEGSERGREEGRANGGRLFLK